MSTSLSEKNPEPAYPPHSGHFPKVRTGWLDLGWTGQFDNEIELLQRVFAEKSSPSCLADTLL